MHVLTHQLRDAPVSPWIGMAIITFYTVLAIGAPLLAPYAESASVGAQYQPWTAPHYLGTDSL